MLNRNYIFIMILLVLTVFVSWELFYGNFSQKDSVSIKDFPESIDQWTSQDLPIDKADSAILETKNAFLRRYSNAQNKHVYLYIAYSQSNTKVTNPPDIFYEDAGISILDKGKDFIIINPAKIPIKANWLLLDNDQDKQLAYYWFKVGDIYTPSYWKEQALTAYSYFLGRRTGSALIRISTDITDGHQNEASQLISEFAGKIGPQLSLYLP